jgi:hypothetical protein
MIIISVVVFMRGRLLQRLGAVHTHSTAPKMRPLKSVPPSPPPAYLQHLRCKSRLLVSRGTLNYLHNQ